MAPPTLQLPRALYRSADVRDLDRAAIDRHGIAGAELMERAGAAAFGLLQRLWPAARRLLVICGTGNNGGDGWVVARLARAGGYTVDVALVGEPARIGGDAATHAARARAAGIEPVELASLVSGGHDVIVDALLGIGLGRPVGGAWLAAIERMNGAGVPVLALDVPSGLDADTGAVLGAAVRAAATVTFIGVKRGLLTGAAADHRGLLWFADLDVPEPIYAAAPRAAELLVGTGLAPRARTSHKGDHGHVLVVGGDHGYAGAARMAAEAALRCGAGLVSLATRGEHAATIAAARPEVMAHGVGPAGDLAPLLGRATVVAAGPGLGRSAWARALLARVLDCGLPLVLDADALGLLGAGDASRGGLVLTPHPGEAARLLDCDTATVQRDRYAAARAIAGRYGAVCVLKGAGTIVDDGDGVPAVCAAGNPGMASGGMGDVLTGIIAALVAQGLAPLAAARAGVGLHAAAGDAAALLDGERGLLATDLLPQLRRLVNGR